MKDWPEISAWRKAQRATLLARRTALDVPARLALDALVARALRAGFPGLSRMTLGFCWPYQGEFDARPAVLEFCRQGALAALPAVVDKYGPLEFRRWWPGVRMAPEVYRIPVPQDTPVVEPDALIVPLTGFDAAGYRLGYGGGYFDRTLAAINPRPLAIGVGYELARLVTLYPQPHDIAMDFIITEVGIHSVEAGRLQSIAPEQAAGQALQLAAQRGLPRPATQAAMAVDARIECASPPCSAADFPDYFADASSLPRGDLLTLLNRLLEAERAGVQVLAVFVREYAKPSAAHATLEQVRRDEAQNCALLIKALRDLGAEPSAATGDFVGKALAVEGRAARLAFLNRGQAWVVRKIGEALPQLVPSPLRAMLEEMHSSHITNIASCDELLQALDG